MRDTHAHLTWRLNFGIARGLAALGLALLTAYELNQWKTNFTVRVVRSV